MQYCVGAYIPVQVPTRKEVMSESDKYWEKEMERQRETEREIENENKHQYLQVGSQASGWVSLILRSCYWLSQIYLQRSREFYPFFLILSVKSLVKCLAKLEKIPLEKYHFQSALIPTRFFKKRLLIRNYVPHIGAMGDTKTSKHRVCPQRL